MILTCPQCATRYQVDGAKFPAAGRNVRCTKCGNVWHQLGPVPEPDPEAELMMEPENPAPRAPEPPPPYNPAPEPAQVGAFSPAASVAADTAPKVQPRARMSFLARTGIVLGWLILIGLIGATGWAAINFRESVAVWAPKTASLYAAAGMPVTPRGGMTFTNVAYHEQTEDGQRVLTVTGRIVNRGTHELSVPLVRVVLFDADRHELYRWTSVAEVSSLKPGATAGFHARLASPPATIRNLEVRFARAGE